MKITATPNRPAVSQTPASNRPSGPQAGAGERPQNSAQVAISPASMKLLELQNGDDDIDVARVEALRDAIAAGKLRIDTSRIADGLIASARELLAK